LKTYADTSFLVSLYVPDVHSDKASAWMSRHTEPLPFTPLHRHELRNAIRLAVWRKQLDGEQRREILRTVETDLKDGFLEHLPVAWTDAFREAEQIGDAQTEQTGVRAADLLHIGIASLVEATEFLTFDATQRKAALGAGLKCRA
jgi:predicted nucleic acid-binding protein